MKLRFIAIALLFACAADLGARTGGGHSYSGGRSSGSSSRSSSSRSSGGGSGSSSSSRSYSSPSSSSRSSGSSADVGTVGCVIALVIVATIIILVAIAMNAQKGGPREAERAEFDPFLPLREIDPNFSRAVFEDFCYSLYEKAHHARGAGDLDRYAPYMSDAARQALLQRNPNALKEVRGIVIGAMAVQQVTVGEWVQVLVAFEANFTEVTFRETSWYVKEEWLLVRKPGVLSPPPAKSNADHCPHCGAPLQTRSDGACAYCGTAVRDGSFNWFVQRVSLGEQEERGPLLTSDVEEEGTDLPTIQQADLQRRTFEFEKSHPGFWWTGFLDHVRKVAIELQAAWSARDWERVRPFETEPLFQTHRYWIDAYLRQNLRNIVDEFHVQRIDPVKIDSDAFYDAITVRIFASGRDYTIDGNGKVAGGSRDRVRSWSEYWTFIRTRGTEATPDATVACPNCGASVQVGSTGICGACGGKLTSGEFGWVLSRIEQDEAYVG